MTKEELIEKWNRNDNPRVRDAWLDREIIGAEVVWEKGDPCRVIREGNERGRHEAVPRWTTNRALAKSLAARVSPLLLTPFASPEAICLKALIRHRQTDGGLWRERTSP